MVSVARTIAAFFSAAAVSCPTSTISLAKTCRSEIELLANPLTSFRVSLVPCPYPRCPLSKRFCDRFTQADFPLPIGVRRVLADYTLSENHY
jgi:hypothetical protein